MSRIDAIFAAAKRDGGSVLMPFVTAGFPDLETTKRVLPELQQAGAGIVELGIPFSDPIADGPVIASSMHAALEHGVTPRRVFEMVKRVRPSVEGDPGLGLLAMVSQSIVARMSPERFFAGMKDAGFDGAILPDIDLEDAAEAAALAERHDLALGLLIAPTSPRQRIRLIVEHCRGFVYVLARAGITGEQQDAPDIAERVALVRSCTDLPIAVGFGISRAEHVAAVTQHADAAIVGSALVRHMGEADDPVTAAAAFTRELVAGLESPGSRS